MNYSFHLSKHPVFVIAFGLIFFCKLTQASEYTFIDIVNDGRGSDHRIIGDFSLNNNGQIVFSSIVSNEIRRISSFSSGQTRILAESRIFTSDPTFSYAAVNDKGEISFIEISREKITLKILSEERNQAIDLHSKNFQAIGLNLGGNRIGYPIWINNHGHVLFPGKRTGSNAILFIYQDGDFKEALKSTDLGSEFSIIGDIAFNDEGTILFSDSDLMQAGGKVKIARNGNVSVVAGPEKVNGFSLGFLGVDINNKNNLIYTPLPQTGLPIYAHINGERKEIAKTISAQGSIIVFGDFSSPTINIHNSISYLAGGMFQNSLTDIQAGNGIFIGPDAQKDQVIFSGNKLFNSELHTIYGDGIKSLQMNDKGQIAFRYQLKNNISGIALAIPKGTFHEVPKLSSGSTLNAASFSLVGQSGHAVAPGTVVSLFGENFSNQLSVATESPLPTRLNGVQVTFNGVEAPLFFVAPGQINAQVPFNVNSSSAQVMVHTPAGNSNSQLVEIEKTSPAIYTYNQQGFGQAIAVLANSATLAAPKNLTNDSRPAQTGDVLTLYVNGLGAVSPPIAAGKNSCEPDSICKPDYSNMVLRTVINPVSIEIGGVTVPSENIHFAGLAPQFVGLYQINLTLPANIPSGDQIPIVIKQGNVLSRPDVIIAVQP